MHDQSKHTSTEGECLEQASRQAKICNRLVLARDSIETGEPWYQAQLSALHAKAQCNDAILAIVRRGLTAATLWMAAAAARSAGYHAAESETEEFLLHFAASLEQERCVKHAEANANEYLNYELLSPGQRTPYSPRPDGAALIIGPLPMTLLVSLTRPTRAEVNELRRGRLRVGLATPLSAGGAGLLAWRFEPLEQNSPGLWFDAPFHIGLNSPESRALPERQPHQLRTVMVVIQDQAACFQGGRVITLSTAFCAALESVVETQATAAAQHGWSYDAAVDAAIRRWPSPQEVMRGATISEIVGRAPWGGAPASTAWEKHGRITRRRSRAPSDVVRGQFTHD